MESPLALALAAREAPLERLTALAALEETRSRFLSRSRSKATARTYSADLRHFFRFLGSEDPCGIPSLDEARTVSWREVTAYRDRFFLPDARTGRSELAAETGARRLSVVASFYDELRRAGVVRENPARDVPRPRASQEGKTRGLSPGEVDRVLAKVPRGSQRGERDLLLLAVFFFQWLRVAEAVRLRVEDISRDGTIPTLRVRQKGGRERVLPLRAEVLELALSYIERFEVAGFLFPALSPGAPDDRPISPEGARLVFKRACAGAGIDASRVSPHSARVTGITAALVADVPLDIVQDFAGHARPETTLRYHRARRRLDRSPLAALPFRMPREAP
ncbi:tyrosine-type recombinase/integrase [bacterium]|nr:tyrosine-type recombinase/integrase [bacterium]